MFENIKCVVFDVFGTLVEITDNRRPYKRLLNALEAAGRPKQTDDASRLMTNDLELQDIAQLLQVEIPASLLESLGMDLFAELESIRTFSEVESSLLALREAGYKIALCSNLATPYAAPVRCVLPFQFDAYAWSFEVGAIKPDPAIYAHICKSLNYSASEVLMIGDTIEADYEGARRFGFKALHLSRNKESSASESISSLEEVITFLAH